MRSVARNEFGVILEDEALDKEAMRQGRDEVLDTLDIFRRNGEEALAYEARLNSPAGLVAFWSAPTDAPPAQAFRTPARLLHNFLASAGTLTDHTRNHVRRCYENHSFWQTYQSEVRSVFGESDLAQFIQDLRNFTLHHSLPITNATLSWGQDRPTTHRFQLDNARLLRSFQWKQRARQFIDEQGDRFAIFPSVAEYMELVAAFHVWREEREQELWHRAMEAQHGPNSRIAREARGEI